VPITSKRRQRSIFGRSSSRGGVFSKLIVGAMLLPIKALIKHSEEKRMSLLGMNDVDRMNGLNFEQYVGNLLKRLGYSVKVTKASGDYGVDIIAKKYDRSYAIQVKRQYTNVSRRAISDAVTGMIHYKCSNSMVITNRYFSKAAVELAKSSNCVLVDRDGLISWIKQVDGRQ